MPVLTVHAVFPHMQSPAFKMELSVWTHTGRVTPFIMKLLSMLHWFIPGRQCKPDTAVHAIFPQMHGPVLDVVPSVTVHGGLVKQKLSDA